MWLGAWSDGWTARNLEGSYEKLRIAAFVAAIYCVFLRWWAVPPECRGRGGINDARGKR